MHDTEHAHEVEHENVEKSAISKHWQAEIQNRHRAQRIETPQIKKTTTAQVEIQRRIRAQRIETTKIN